MKIYIHLRAGKNNPISGEGQVYDQVLGNFILDGLIDATIG